jgi:hypothetical protein
MLSSVDRLHIGAIFITLAASSIGISIPLVLAGWGKRSDVLQVGIEGGNVPSPALATVACVFRKICPRVLVCFCVQTHWFRVLRCISAGVILSVAFNHTVGSLVPCGVLAILWLVMA